MSKIEVDAIDKQSGSTLTLGGSGTAVTLACGATQTGFGRTGTVDWQTTIKTGDFTASNGEGYFIDTSSGAVTVTLPSSPSAGNIVAVKDYANTADTNAINIGRNGSKIDGETKDAKVSNEGGAVTFVFTDSTKGWLVTDAAQKSDINFPEFIAATGGTITTVCTNFKVHTFTGPGTFCVSATGNATGSNTIDYLVIAGGGGASGGDGPGPNSNYAAGGGGGGYRESSGAASGSYTISPLGACVSALPVSATGYPVTVGAGGAGVCGEATPGNPGSNSVFAGTTTITSAGGGHGAPGNPAPTGAPGGSGGGGAASGGTGNTPPVTPPQGQPGGTQAGAPPNYGRGGGGGATAPGGNGTPTVGGAGGAGGTSSINGTPTGRGGGGGGGVYSTGTNTGTKGVGADGGGDGGQPTGPTSQTAGAVNTGGGAGGGSMKVGPNFGTGTGKSGGSGIVIIRYKFQ